MYTTAEGAFKMLTKAFEVCHEITQAVKKAFIFLYLQVGTDFSLFFFF